MVRNNSASSIYLKMCAYTYQFAENILRNNIVCVISFWFVLLVKLENCILIF